MKELEIELESKKKYEEIGGWLYLLCFLLIIISPIRNSIGIYIDYKFSSSYFTEIIGLEKYFYLNTISVIIIILFGIRAGISLLLIKPNAVKQTKLYLTLFLIYGLIQNSFPEMAGLEKDFENSLETQMMATTISSILVFGIWFMYLNLSKRVKETYPNSIEKNNPKIENQKSNIFSNKLSIFENIIKNVHTTKIIPKIKNTTNLSFDLIIISSIIVGTLIALILGYYFGETYYFHGNGRRALETYHTYKEFHFNYLIGTLSFIIFGGIAYIFLNLKNKKS